MMHKADKNRDGVITLATFANIVNTLDAPSSALNPVVIESVYRELGGRDLGIEIDRFQKNMQVFKPSASTQSLLLTPARNPLVDRRHST
jgi:hypothetical protein